MEHMVKINQISSTFKLKFLARIAPRSGLAVKNHIDVGAGVIDPDFRGNIGKTLNLKSYIKYS